MILNFFSSCGWQEWDVERQPLVPEGMPALVDDDLLFEDSPAAPRATTVVNRRLRDETIAELVDFKSRAICRLVAQHDEITQLRAALADSANVRRLPVRTVGTSS
jgi:hypothetical protein